MIFFINNTVLFANYSVSILQYHIINTPSVFSLGNCSTRSLGCWELVSCSYKLLICSRRSSVFWSWRLEIRPRWPHCFLIRNNNWSEYQLFNMSVVLDNFQWIFERCVGSWCLDDFCHKYMPMLFLNLCHFCLGCAISLRWFFVLWVGVLEASHDQNSTDRDFWPFWVLKEHW